MPGKYGTGCVHDRGIHAISGIHPRGDRNVGGGRPVRHPRGRVFTGPLDGKRPPNVVNPEIYDR